jgi:CspA family cold shock protein
MKTGIVKFYSSANKYGFIKPDDGSDDVFFHENELKSSNIDKVKSKQKVQYELAGTGEKTFASNIKIIFFLVFRYN